MEDAKERSERTREHAPHDEAFKKLLQTFFAEFIELFFPKIHKLLDFSQTRFLMQEQLVDVVGEQTLTLDLLLETKYKGEDAYILIHLEPQSYRDAHFHERMFVYFGRLFERHRKQHELIIPIAIFTMDQARRETDSLKMAVTGQTVLYFRFLKVELSNMQWRRFVDSDNPVAAALLAKMRYNESEIREVRFAYLRMLLRLRKKLDDAKLALMMSVADLYNKCDEREDVSLLRELREKYPEEGDIVDKLMPAWSRAGYEKGIKEGIEQGIEQGVEHGMATIVMNMLREGVDDALVIKVTGWPEEKIAELRKRVH
ncbi:Rpn family recombination-promoting nuclease/putative transposase [Paenibacillaceae bacterium WGS1546]|uniref:Rpn family recombination-promoting nuclease/putative transposase n=1 Tax=Cohnella sp. WGS1546 TaxID=3366810 RepID=UPI00372D38D7